MSECFVLAGSLHLPAAAYATWLASPAPGPASLSDWDAMYAGWQWDGKRPGGRWQPRGTVEATLARMLSWAATDPWVVLLRHEGDVFRFVVMSAMGPDDTVAEELMAVVRSASAFVTSRSSVAYWSEPSGLFDFAGVTSVAIVEPGHSAFVARADREALCAALAACDAWLGGYLESAGATDAWARPSFADARFIELVRAGAG